MICFNSKGESPVLPTKIKTILRKAKCFAICSYWFCALFVYIFLIINVIPANKAIPLIKKEIPMTKKEVSLMRKEITRHNTRCTFSLELSPPMFFSWWNWDDLRIVIITLFRRCRSGVVKVSEMRDIRRRWSSPADVHIWTYVWLASLASFLIMWFVVITLFRSCRSGVVKVSEMRDIRKRWSSPADVHTQYHPLTNITS